MTSPRSSQVFAGTHTSGNYGDFDTFISPSTNPDGISYCLNYKGINYKTIWVEYPDVEATIKKIGAKPTGVDPMYTLPAIVDDSTGVAMAESADIVEYLDKMYPDTPRLIPDGTHALQAAFRDAFYPKLKDYSMFLASLAELLLNPPSVIYLDEKAKIRFGKTFREMIPHGEERVAAWNKWKDTIGTIDAWMRKEDVWMMGDTPSFADFILASFILSAETVFGPDSKEYKEVLEMHDGRWGRLAKNVEKYKQVL